MTSCTRGAGALPADYRIRPGIGRSGDLVLARVLEVGCYPRVEIPSGREVRLRAGDELVAVLGNRQSSTSLVGGVPADGLPVGHGCRADLLAAGGVVGITECSPSFLGPPTRLELIGLLHDGRTGLALTPKAGPEPAGNCPIVFVGGTAAEVGKTTFAAALVHHLAREFRVGVTKLAGTGRLRDLLTLADAGAVCAADFVDAGLATTYGHDGSVVVAAAHHLVDRLVAAGSEVIVAELGGDLWAAGIPALLADPALRQAACALVLVPSDTMASLGAHTWLAEQQLDLPVAHAVPYRNVLAARQRLRDGLGVEPFDATSAEDLQRFCAEFGLTARARPELATT
ncbi:MAG TPA: hypothetical protein VFU36_00270 [Jatrophihabitans sp.]|nr:hypothetical protein [Jatrophihabitans sp.]